MRSVALLGSLAMVVTVQRPESSRIVSPTPPLPPNDPPYERCLGQSLVNENALGNPIVVSIRHLIGRKTLYQDDRLSIDRFALYGEPAGRRDSSLCPPVAETGPGRQHLAVRPLKDSGGSSGCGGWPPRILISTVILGCPTGSCNRSPFGLW